jgi:hypothetical protein
MEFSLVFLVLFFPITAERTLLFLTPCKKRAHCGRVMRTLFDNITLWPETASELCRPSDYLLSTKLVTTFEDVVCHVVSVTDPYRRIIGFDDNRLSVPFCAVS